MNGTSKLFGLALAGGILLGAAGDSVAHQGRSKEQTPPPARSGAEETLESWNHIGNKLIALAKDFPEDQYDFKVQKDERTFAQAVIVALGHASSDEAAEALLDWIDAEHDALWLDAGRPKNSTQQPLGPAY